MEKEQIVTKLTEVIHDVLPELDEDSIYVTTLNKGLYGRPLNRPQESFVCSS